MRQGKPDYSQVGLVSKDSIILSESSVNWMTTQSLGGTDLIYEKYAEILLNDGFTMCGHACTSLRFGIANGTQFFANGIMFTVLFWRLEQDPSRFKQLLECLFIIFLAIMGNLNSMT